jgi:hypothetical protein
VLSLLSAPITLGANQSWLVTGSATSNGLFLMKLRKTDRFVASQAAAE